MVWIKIGVLYNVKGLKTLIIKVYYISFVPELMLICHDALDSFFSFIGKEFWNGKFHIHNPFASVFEISKLKRIGSSKQWIQDTSNSPNIRCRWMVFLSIDFWRQKIWRTANMSRIFGSEINCQTKVCQFDAVSSSKNIAKLDIAMNYIIFVQILHSSA